MKGSALFDTMTAGVTARCNDMIGAARREAQGIVAEAQAKAAAQREQVMEATNTEMAVLDARWKLKGEAEAIRAELAMKKAAVNETLNQVEKAIQDTVSSPGFPAVLDALLGELMGAAEGGEVVVAPEAHVDHVRRWLSSNGHDGLSVEASSTLRDGVALQDPARTYRISNTLSGRYARVEQETRRACMTGLFGETQGSA